MRPKWSTGYARYDIMGGSQRLLPGVKTLLIVNVAVYLLQQFFDPRLTMTLGVTPTRVLQDLAVYQLITYMFLHGNLFHILINMFVLWMFGREIEQTWGTKRFVWYYLLTGLAGGIFTVVFQPNFTLPTIGASGAIYGVLAAYAVMFPNRTIYLFLVVPIKVKYAVVLFVGLELLASMNATSDGIGHWAHLGGAAVGFLYLKLNWRLSRVARKISPLRAFDRFNYRHKNRKLEKNRQKTDEIMKRVDEILDKINDVGIDNITEEERRFLGDASEILSRRDT